MGKTHEDWHGSWSSVPTMIPFRTQFVLLLLCCAAIALHGQQGSPSAVTPISGQINRYESVSVIFACDTMVRVRGASQFRAGDEVLMIQMKGARINEENDSTYGQYANMNGAGCVEFLTILRVDQDRIVFTRPWVHPYSADGSIQLVSVPRYTDVVTDGDVTAPAWNGMVGGVVVLRADGTLTLDADIDVSGKGFRGGYASFPRDVCAPTLWGSYYLYGEGGEKGDGIATTQHSQALASKGPFGNGGGGGNGANAGGAGGSNAGSGGRGGDANTWCVGYRGIGGYPGVTVDTLLLKQRVFLGGGGGGGHQNNNQGTAGAAGGGIVIVVANGLNMMGGSIIARGLSVRDTAAWDGKQFLQPGDGAGGGGAGGTVLLDIGVTRGTATVDARGGNGGNVGARYQPNGPGGGGGGGAVVMTKPVPGVTTRLDGGSPGIHLSPETADEVRYTSWGATQGVSGTVINGFTWKTYTPLTLSAMGGGDICPGGSRVLTASEGFMFYRWSNGSTERSVTAAVPGEYSVTAIDSSGCSQTVRGIVVTLDPVRLQVPTRIDFGTVDYRTGYTKDLVIKSEDDDTVVIQNIAAGTHFRVVDASVFPLSIAPNTTVTIPIVFTSKVPDEYFETLTVEVVSPCRVLYPVAFRAKVDPIRVRFSMPDTTAKRGATNVELPITTQLLPDSLDLPNVHLRITVSMNSTLFAPSGITRGTIVDDVIDVIRSRRTVTIDLDSLVISAGRSTLTSIRGTVLLSGVDKTVLDIDSVEWILVEQTPITIIQDGTLDVAPTCFTDARIVKFLTPTVLRVGPNPVHDVIEINANLHASGMYDLAVIDLQGNTVYQHAERVNHGDAERTMRLTLPTQAWQQGSYVVRFTTPLQTFVEPVVVTR